MTYYPENGVGLRSVKGFLITEEHLIFLVGSDEQEIDLSPEEISLLIERKNVPVGLFMAYLGELSNLKPAYNWFLKTVKNKRFEEIFTIIMNFPRLSDGSPPPTVLNTFRSSVTPPEEYIRSYQGLLRHLRSRYAWLESFKEMDHSRIQPERLGPTYSLTEDEWRRAYGKYPFK